ncbi:hypothetical protein LTR10_009581 [Elasticomyces elasticus]|nr:hypothetical protein LTR10_009581 [Elasticomyces elasticus]KAK4971324.1 hypothetical protein LTR42_007050 [Elasticomyces elasticus]
MDTAQLNGNRIYAPIDTQAKEIRLFLLTPGGNTEVPTGVLLPYKLEDCPAYHALSYIWGDASFKIPITVNGCSFMVTGNLYAALEKLRDPDAEVLLWIDAISIEQSNLEERSRHVTYMHIVYQQAVSVIVWLGRASKDSAAAFDQIEAICKRCLPWPENEREMNAKFASAIESVITAYLHRRTTHDPWRPLANLFSRPWWQRIWVVQEVAFSHPVVVMCGHRKASMAHLLLAGEAFRQLHFHSPDLLTQDPRLVADNTYVDFLASVVVPTQLLTYQALRREVKDVNLEHRACSDPRDKIFGLLNLVARDQWPCKPDYRSDAKESFKLAMLKIVELRNDLNILASCKAETNGRWPVSSSHLGKLLQEARLADLPSWIPDWTTVRLTFPLPGGIGSDEAYLNTNNRSRFEVIGNTLFVRGLILGTIQHVSAFYISKGYDARNVHIYQQLGDFLATHGGQISTNEAVVEADHIKEQLRVEVSILLGDPEILGFNSKSGLSKRNVPTVVEYIAWRMSGVLDVPEAISDAAFKQLLGRRALITETGRRGISRCAIEQGDVVAWVLGCHAPLVLRKSGASDSCKIVHRIIGEAYVIDAMVGEMDEGEIGDILLA